MARAHIFVVDDEPDILELVHYNLTQHGYDVSCSLSGEEGLVQMRSRPPDLLLLDVMLPGMDGLEVCKALKQNSRTADLPIIMLTARSEEADIVAGLELGADDYLTKPFSTRVLLARIKAVLRRHHTATPTETEELIRGDLVIRPGRYEVLAIGQPVQLTRTEFRILHLLARRPGWVFTRNQIIEAAQGDDTSVTARSVDVHMVSLRRKLGSYGEAVETMRGVGYRFKDSEE
jgi:two-component system, OmpR family, alkaline phosphatase synthesis response regulator PhoP